LFPGADALFNQRRKLPLQGLLTGRFSQTVADCGGTRLDTRNKPRGTNGNEEVTEAAASQAGR
ncbi:MAG TPA: hypothetical protein VN229_20050, partial [Terriglobales bacterium]|nr:hypothetical protein [Terriglobales bacterium]